MSAAAPADLTEDDVWVHAREVLTGKQYQALEMKHRQNMSYRAIGVLLGVTRQAVVDRVKTAERKLAVSLG